MLSGSASAQSFIVCFSSWDQAAISVHLTIVGGLVFDTYGMELIQSRHALVLVLFATQIGQPQTKFQWPPETLSGLRLSGMDASKPVSQPNVAPPT